MDRSKPKPDMMAASPASRGGKRILAQLEHGVRPAAGPARGNGWTIDGWTVGLGVLLLLMCSVAWMVHEKKITPSTFKYDESRSRPATMTSRMEMQAPTAMPVPVAQAASIVNEPSLGIATPQARATIDQAAGPSTVPRALQVVAKQKATTSRNTAGVANTTPAAQDATRDTDIALLTALVAHANKPTVTVAERSRDVVERQEGDSTAQLLARCQQLGLIESMLCRSRICSGRWDADAACRAPAH